MGILYSHAGNRAFPPWEYLRYLIISQLYSVTDTVCPETSKHMVANVESDFDADRNVHTFAMSKDENKV